MAPLVINNSPASDEREFVIGDSIKRIIATPSACARQSFFYIQEAGEICSRRRFSTERRGINSYLVSYTISGTGYLTYDDKQYTLRPGQAFFIDCNKYHSYRTDEADLWNMVWLHIYGATSVGYYGEFTKVNSSPVIPLSPSTNIVSNIRQIIDMHEKSIQNVEVYTSLIILDVLTELLLCAHSDLPEYSAPNDISMIIDYLSKHYSKKVKLDDLASEFSLNKYHLHRAFKQITGCTPNEYLIRIRITRAKQLLCETDTSVREVAEQVGVDNTSHFINLFKAHEGVTPSSFRKLWKSAHN